jgi:hypothetical protein
LTPFGTNLLFVEDGGTRIGVISAAFAITYKALPFVAQDWYTVMAVINGSYLYILDSSGYVWRTNDLATWTLQSYVPGAISIAAFGTDMIVSDIGTGARLWRVAV